MIVARYGNRCHAPEHSRAALLSAWVLGADALWVRARVTADGRLVLATEDDTAVATGQAGRVTATALRDLRQLDYSHYFAPRGSPGFRYRPAGRAPLRVEVFSDFLDWVPDQATVVVE
ncbi:MAG TPA: glycerophosphodiester phosphodiesterase family protein, partial [Candidatus Limnocylindrales bacterium]